MRQGGRAAAEGIPDMLGAVMAIVRPVVECNRAQIDNGRTYLREMIFGDPRRTPPPGRTCPDATN